MEVEIEEIKENNRRQVRQIRDLKGDLRRYEYEVDVLSHSKNGKLDSLIGQQIKGKTRFANDDYSLSRNN